MLAATQKLAPTSAMAQSYASTSIQSFNPIVQTQTPMESQAQLMENNETVVNNLLDKRNK